MKKKTFYSIFLEAEPPAAAAPPSADAGVGSSAPPPSGGLGGGGGFGGGGLGGGGGFGGGGLGGGGGFGGGGLGGGGSEPQENEGPAPLDVIKVSDIWGEIKKVAANKESEFFKKININNFRKHPKRDKKSTTTKSLDY